MEIIKMTLDDLEQINLDEFDDFWNYNILKEELLSDASYYIVAKSENEILGFAGLKFLLDEAHITNIVTKKDKRNSRYWFKAFRVSDSKGKRNLFPNYFRGKYPKPSCNSLI